MKLRRITRGAGPALLLALLTGPAHSDAEPACLGCHTDNADKPIHALFKTPHGKLQGGGAMACIACHGASEAHAGNPTMEKPTTSFGPRWGVAPAEANTACLSCHDKEQQMFWLGSGHEQEDLACTNCHRAHINRDPVLSDSGQLDACLGCHTRRQAELRLPSRHPILEGKTSCTDCHNPHGSGSESALVAATLNDTCYGCHQEKRGPFLWEHPPAAEDCSNCHTPHGSVHANLLTARAPFMCQQCHSAAFHPSQLYDGQSIRNNTANQYILGKSCLNCHSQIHGSNHPSGARLTR